jgi:predicted SAM-dependent methyltransferase
VRRHPAVRVRIIGADNPHANGREGAWQDWLSNRAGSEPHIYERIVFDGEVGDAALFQAYADCDIFCAPSRYESFGLVHVEAMMFGRPVVGCRAGGMQETIVDGVTGLLVEPGDASALEAALERLVTDHRLREELGAAGRARYEAEFANAVAVRRNLEYYHRLLAVRQSSDQPPARQVVVDRATELLASLIATSRPTARAAAEHLVDRGRFPVDHEYGVRRILDIDDEEEFVAGLYRALLGRDPEPGFSAKGFYGPELSTGDRMAVVRTIARSVEARARGVDLSFLDRLPPVNVRASAAASGSWRSEPLTRARVRRNLRRLRDVVTGVNALRAALEEHNQRLAPVPRLVQRELSNDIAQARQALTSDIGSAVEATTRGVRREVDLLRADAVEPLRAQLDVMARKQEVLATDVREKVPDAVFDSLPEPVIVDPEAYARRLSEMREFRVNLGCGEKPLPGYINVDLRHLPDVDVMADVRRLPFAEGTVTEIASAHLVEHFRQHHLETVVLPHWRSLLKDDGLVRIVCPNWLVLIEHFNQGRLTINELKQVTFGLQDYAGDDHLAMYTPETLTETLLAAGFRNVEILEDRRQNGLSPEMEITARVAPTRRPGHGANSRTEPAKAGVQTSTAG